MYWQIAGSVAEKGDINHSRFVVVISWGRQAHMSPKVELSDSSTRLHPPQMAVWVSFESHLDQVAYEK